MYNPAMGFLEGLRRKKAEEDEAEKRAKANTERERIAGLERAKEQQLQREKEAEKAKNLLAKSKTKFHQAGMPELIKQLDEIKPIRFEEGYPEDEPRSEEHTSELQSPDHLVCRLLLEKKNKN